MMRLIRPRATIAIVLLLAILATVHVSASTYHTPPVRRLLAISKVTDSTHTSKDSSKDKQPSSPSHTTEIPPPVAPPTTHAHSAKETPDEVAEEEREPRHTANPTLHNSGSGTLAVILTALGILICVAASYVCYLRFFLGIRSNDSAWIDLKSTFHLGDDAYQPVSSAYRPPTDYPRMPESSYPVATPANIGSLALTDVGAARQAQRERALISPHHQQQSTQQHHHQAQQPRYEVDADDLEYYSGDEQ